MVKAKGTAHRTTAQRVADAELQLNRLREKSRKEATRRKILVGAMMLDQAEYSPQMRQQIMAGIDNWLSNGHRDRRLFLDYGIGSLRGLYGATLYLAEEPPPGWAIWWSPKAKARAQPLKTVDRYGNVIDVS